RGAQALVGVARWHPHVDDAQVGAVRGHRGDEGRAVLPRGDHLVAGISEHQLHALTQEEGVIGKHDPHRTSRNGTRAANTVGPPSGESTCSAPSTAASRWARPVSPCPFDSWAPPRPSSRMLTRTSPCSTPTSKIGRAHV